jgi:hypothetical protein
MEEATEMTRRLLAPTNCSCGLCPATRKSVELRNLFSIMIQNSSDAIHRVLTFFGPRVLPYPFPAGAQTCQTSQNPESMTSPPRKYISPGMPHTAHQVSPERLEEFRRIYKETYGEEISVGEASAMTHRLIALYKLLSQPLPDEVSSSKPAPSPPSPAQNDSEES